VINNHIEQWGMLIEMQKDERKDKQHGIEELTELLKKTKPGSKEQKEILNKINQFMKGEIPTAPQKKK